jgi:hypothetical protein
MDVTDLAALGSLAGNTLVAAAVTDAWETARHRFACLFGHGKPDPVTERRLDVMQGQLASVTSADIERVKANLAAQWATRTEDFLGDNPGAEADLRVLLDELQALLPTTSVSGSDHSLAAGHDISVSASEHGFAAGVIHGNVGLPSPPVPGRASG